MPEAGIAEKTPEIAANRGWQSYTRKRPRSLVPTRLGKGTTAKLLFVRAVQWILPWSISDYPGVWRGSVELLGGKWTLETVKSYRKGARDLPSEAALMLAGAIRARVIAGLALVAELEAYAEANPRKKPAPGFRAVDPVTGQDKRGGKVGRKRKVKEV